MGRDAITNRFAVGDVICKGNAYMTQAKIIAVRDAPHGDGDVVYTVATHNKRVAEWVGSTWWFTDPTSQVNWLLQKAESLTERANRIQARIDRTKGVV